MTDLLENVALFFALMAAGVTATFAVLIVLVKIFEFNDSRD